MTTKRGTSNSNARGSTTDRRRRKVWLLATFSPELGPDKVVCEEDGCTEILTYETMTVDRILPGALGGRYTRDNIRPMCEPCNIWRGLQLREQLHRQNCRGTCRRCMIVAEYRAAREAAELAREATTYGYETENREYGRLITFRDFLEAYRQTPEEDYTCSS